MKGLYEFLDRVAVNNNRPWFAEHRREYDELRARWIEDLDKLIACMSVWEPGMATQSGRSAAYRFYRDTRFSPDGRQILVKASPAAFDGLGSEVKPGQQPQAFDNRLYLYDIASRQTTALLKGFAPSVASYEWSAADNKVYFSADDRAYHGLFSLDMRTRKVVRYELPVTSVQGYSIATATRNPRAVFFGQTAERAREMFTCNLTDKSKPATTLTGKIRFDELYKDVAIGTCHEWQFKATRGDSIDGFYLLPPDFNPEQTYPLIVYYYGGCTPTTQCLEF